MHLVPVIEDIQYRQAYAKQKLWNQMDTATGSRPVP